MEVANVWLRRALCLVECVAKFSRDADAVLGPLVNVEHDFAQARALETRQDGVDCGSLLGDEQNLPPPRDQGGDEVGDGLALARTRWAVNDQAAAGQDGVDRFALRGVRIQYREILLWQVQRGWRGLVRAERFLGVGIACDGGDDV